MSSIKEQPKNNVAKNNVICLKKLLPQALQVIGNRLQNANTTYNRSPGGKLSERASHLKYANKISYFEVFCFRLELL